LKVINRLPTLLMVICLLSLFGYGIWQYFNPQVIIEWSTASEVDSLGFFIFRGDSKDGPFEKQINLSIIPSKGQIVTGADYSITDQNVIPGFTYYYQLHEIQLDGATETFGPIEIIAKRNGLLEIILSIALGFMLRIFNQKKRLLLGKGDLDCPH